MKHKYTCLGEIGSTATLQETWIAVFMFRKHKIVVHDKKHVCFISI